MNDRSHGGGSRIAIFWDLENCGVPKGLSPEEVSTNIINTLRPRFAGAVSPFSAYGDTRQISNAVREGFQKTGITLIDVPGEKKDAADRSLLIDMFLFATDYPPPACIMLISSDVDFAPGLHKLVQRGYTVLLAIPSKNRVSRALTNAAEVVRDWPSLAKGEISSVNLKQVVITSAPSTDKVDEKLQAFKLELQDIIRSYPDKKVVLCVFELIYEHRFQKKLDYPSFGVTKLEELLEKLVDFVTVVEEGKRKLLVLKAV